MTDRRIYLNVWKDDQPRQTLMYREGQEDVRERDRRDFLLAGWSTETFEEEEQS